MIGVVSETLEEIDTRSKVGSFETNEDNDTLKKYRKRKHNLSAPPPISTANVNNLSGKRTLIETMKFPHVQPTHTGYLISATLLPLFI